MPHKLVINPITGAYFSSAYFDEELPWRQNLPMFQDAAKLRLFSMLDKHQGIIVSSQTGSGKTVVAVPQLLEYLDYQGTVLCVQPKRLPAYATAKTVAEGLDVKFGEDVGYAHGGEAKWIPGHTKILFATEGTVIQIMLNNPTLIGFSAIAMDEVHERSPETDVLLFLLQALVKSGKRKDMPILMLSATIDPKAFSRYFRAARGGMALLKVPGITSPYTKELRFLSYDPKGDNIYKAGTDIVVKLLKTTPEPDGDIIFFLPTAATMKTVAFALDAARENILDKFQILVLMRKSTEEEKAIATGSTGIRAADLGVKRKVILATDIAEASLTFDNMLHVVDSGVKLAVSFSAESRANVMDIQPIAQSNIIQRIGRTGRNRSGYAHLLYTKENFEARPQFKTPSIKTVDPTASVLGWLSKGLTGAKSLRQLHKNMLSKFMDPFDTRWTNVAKITLLEYGFLNKDTTLTPLGKRLAPYGLSPGMCVAMDHAVRLGCADVMLLISTLESFTDPIDISDKLTKHMERVDPAAHICGLWQKCIVLKMYLEHSRINPSHGRDDEKTSVTPPSLAAQWCDKQALDPKAFEELGRSYDKQLNALISVRRQQAHAQHVNRGKDSLLTRATACIAAAMPHKIADINPDGSFQDRQGRRLKCKDALIKNNPHVKRVVYLSLSKAFNKLEMTYPIPIL